MFRYRFDPHWVLAMCRSLGPAGGLTKFDGAFSLAQDKSRTTIIQDSGTSLSHRYQV